MNKGKKSFLLRSQKDVYLINVPSQRAYRRAGDNLGGAKGGVEEEVEPEMEYDGLEREVGVVGRKRSKR